VGHVRLLSVRGGGTRGPGHQWGSWSLVHGQSGIWPANFSLGRFGMGYQESLSGIEFRCEHQTGLTPVPGRIRCWKCGGWV